MGRRTIGRERVHQLLEEGAQIVEVLEERQFRAAHLPGATHLPVRQLTRERAGELDPDRPVIVYCYDAL